MHRFFVDRTQINDQYVVIDGEDYKHITKVLRLKSGETIEVCDGEENDYEVMIQGDENQRIVGKIIKSQKSLGETKGMTVVLFQGLPKGQKMELIIQKSVEHGVNEIIPFQSKRSISQIKEKKDKKTDRWQRIAYEAAKQSKRGRIPEVSQVLTFKEVLDRGAGLHLVLMAYENEKTRSLKKYLSALPSEITGQENLKIGIMIGPEGGFDVSEVLECEARGIKSISLGNRILRTETAGITVLSQLNFWKEDLI
ncbi:MAG: RsmE family RNA methyltransferase [Eubacteriaceae bacterium]